VTYSQLFHSLYLNPLLPHSVLSNLCTSHSIVSTFCSRYEFNDQQADQRFHFTQYGIISHYHPISWQNNSCFQCSMFKSLQPHSLLFATGKLEDPHKRPASIPAHSPENRVSYESRRRRSSTDCPGHQTSPSYCIRDMAALFENRRDTPNQTPSRPAPVGKQYLSSV